MKNKLFLAACAYACIHSSLFAQDGTGKKPGNLMEILVLFILPFIVIFYLFFIRPQKKEQKKRQEVLSSVEKGDKIRTIGGIFGKVTNVTDEQITLLIDENKDIKIKMMKRAVASIKGKTEDIDESKS